MHSLELYPGDKSSQHTPARTICCSYPCLRGGRRWLVQGAQDPSVFNRNSVQTINFRSKFNTTMSFSSKNRREWRHDEQSFPSKKEGFVPRTFPSQNEGLGVLAWHLFLQKMKGSCRSNFLLLHSDHMDLSRRHWCNKPYQLFNWSDLDRRLRFNTTSD